MRFHDHYLVGYVVSDFGQTITLNLVLDIDNSTTPDSVVEFVGVAAYQFSHSDGAIITDIREESLSDLLEHRQSEIESVARVNGLRHWNSDFDSYRESLIDNNFRAWSIDSAIGFKGYVVAKSVSQIEE